MALAFFLVIVGLSICGGCQWYISRQQKEYVQLTAAANCQTDVIGPFIQDNLLAHTVPNEFLQKDFEAFLNAQVSKGSLSKEAALKVLEEIRNRDQKLPVYTVRGWVLPILVQSQ